MGGPTLFPDEDDSGPDLAAVGLALLVVAILLAVASLWFR